MCPPETLVVKGGTTWAKNGRWILTENARLPRNIQGSFTCRKSTTWENDFTFLPKEGVLRIFSPWKIRRLRPCLNPRTWLPKASTLPVDHRSRLGARTDEESKSFTSLSKVLAELKRDKQLFNSDGKKTILHHYKGHTFFNDTEWGGTNQCPVTWVMFSYRKWKILTVTLD